MTIKLIGKFTVANNKTILLVEDEKITAAITAKILEKNGFSVIKVHSGEEAVKTIDNIHDIDLILMDIDLGSGIDGTEAGSIILKRHDIPLVFISSHTEPEIVNKTKKITNYGYIVKGCGEVVLIASIEMALKLFYSNQAVKEHMKKHKESDLLFRTMLDLVPDLISIQDMDMNILYSNWQGIGNVPEERRINKKCHKAYRDHDDICPDCFINELQEKRHPLKIQKKNAEGIWVDMHIIPIFDENNEIKAFMEWVRDINSEKETLNELQKSKENYKFTTEYMPSMICEFLPDSTLTYVNTTYCKYFGMTSDQLIGKPFIELIPESQRKSVMENYLSLSPEKPIKKYTHEAMVNGSIRYQEWINRAFFDNTNKVIKYISIGTDITDTLRLQKDLEEKTKLLIEITDNMFDLVCLTDLEGNVKFISKSHERLGFDPESSKGTNVLDGIHPSDLPRIKKAFSAPLNKWNINERVEYRYRRADGEYVWLETLAKPIKNKSGDIIERLFSSRDITQRKHSEGYRQFQLKFHQNISRFTFSMTCAKDSFELNKILEELLKFLGESFEVNRTYIFEFSENLDTMSNIYEWCSKGTKSQKRRAQDIPVKDYPWFINQILENGYFNISMVDQIPPEALKEKKELQIQGIQSIMEIGICDSKGSFVGFIGFDMVQSTRDWSEEEIAMLRFVAGSIGTIIERNKSLQELKESETRFKALHNASFGGIAIHRNGTILDCNEGLSRITGYSSQELTGMDILNLIAKRSRDLAIRNLAEDFEDPYEAFGLTKDGREYPLRIEGRNIYYHGQKARVVEFRDITDQKQAEENLRKALLESEELRAKTQSLLSEKELILRESHHRIKNNMNTVYSLLQLQAMETKDENVAQILNESISRIKSMILLYNKLYLAENLDEINVQEYLPHLIDEISSLLYSPIPITIKSDIENIILNPKTLIPLNIIINELISNSYKHAFADKKTGQITIILKKKDDKAVFIYKDNGTWSQEQKDNGQTLGMQLIEGLVSQIKGIYKINRDSGTNIIIEFDIL